MTSLSEPMAETPKVLERFRADAVVAGVRDTIDGIAMTDELEHIATLIPDEWLAPSATGTADACAHKVRGQLELGADAVIMHGATPTELAPIVDAYADAVSVAGDASLQLR